MNIGRWLTQHDVRSSVSIQTEKKPHPDVPKRTTMKRAVTINRAELKLASAVAAEATRKLAVQFKRAATLRPAGTRCTSSSLRREPRASEVDRGRRFATRRRYDPPLASLARTSRRSERSSCSTCRMQWLPRKSLLADNQDTLTDEAGAHATRAAHRRTTVCAGAQRAAAAAALKAQATLPGSSTSCGQARSTTTRRRSRRSARELSGTSGRCSFRRRSRRPTPAARSGVSAAYG
jgi:hypothetical protein